MNLQRMRENHAAFTQVEGLASLRIGEHLGWRRQRRFETRQQKENHPYARAKDASRHGPRSSLSPATKERERVVLLDGISRRFRPNVPPLPCPLLHFMEEREFRRGYLVAVLSCARLPAGCQNALAGGGKPATLPPRKPALLVGA